MHITIGMIVLNEEEYLERNLRQHYEYADKIIIVEGADRLYPRTNVTPDGLSTDATASIIRDFPDPSKKIEFIQHGWTNMGGDQAKCELRNEYLKRSPEGLLIAIDADEFYFHEDLQGFIDSCRHQPKIVCWCIPSLHFWKQYNQFITGGYYDFLHSRFFQIKPGDIYRNNHNQPTRNGVELLRLGHFILPRVIHTGLRGHSIQRPACYHFGFCKKPQNYKDKQKYYENRGERTTRFHTWIDRRAWFRPDETLGANLRLHPYFGPLPEAFSEEPKNEP